MLCCIIRTKTVHNWTMAIVYRVSSVCLNRTSVSLEWLRLLAGSLYTGFHSSSTQVKKSFQPATCNLENRSGQNAYICKNLKKCRLQTGCKMQTEGCRLSTKCRLGSRCRLTRKDCSFFNFRLNETHHFFITVIYHSQVDLPTKIQELVTMQSLIKAAKEIPCENKNYRANTKWWDKLSLSRWYTNILCLWYMHASFTWGNLNTFKK